MNKHTLFLCIGCILFSLWIYSPPLLFEDARYELYFCPKDNCTQIMIDELEKAKTISCAFYDLDHPDIIHILQEKNATVYVDYHTKTSFGTRLKTPGLMHHKFCILDKNKTLTGSTNPTINGLTKNQNNLLLISSKDITKEYIAELHELEKNQFRGGKISRHSTVFFCPEDNCEQKIIEAINSAQKRVYIMAFTFTSTSIANHLVLAKHKGIDVQVIFENRQRSFWQADFLHYQEIPTFIYKQNAILHHKVFIIDNITYTGSYNPTKAGTDKNEENIIKIENISLTNQFENEFVRLKKLSQPLNMT